MKEAGKGMRELTLDEIEMVSGGCGFLKWMFSFSIHVGKWK